MGVAKLRLWNTVSQVIDPADSLLVLQCHFQKSCSITSEVLFNFRSPVHPRSEVVCNRDAQRDSPQAEIFLG
jgi:hypothetical protein